MAFQVSPGVVVKEFDVSTVVPQVDVSLGGIAGVFRWGPIGQVFLVTSEADLVKYFGTPTNFNAETWFSAQSFLAYSGGLYVSRAANTTAANANGVLTAMANTANVANVASQIVLNDLDYVNKVGTFDTGVQWIARYPGALGNSLRVSVVDAANQYSSNINLATLGSGSTLTLPVGSNTATVNINAASITAANTAASSLVASFSINDLLFVGNSAIGQQYLKVSSLAISNVQGNTTTGNATVTISFTDVYKLHTDFATGNTITRYWEFFQLIDQPPGQSTWQLANGNTSANDELHVVVVDNLGQFSGGVPGTVLEVFHGVSRSTDALTPDGLTNYYKDSINKRSSYIRWANDRPNAVSNTGANLVSATTTAPMNLTFQGGGNGPGESTAALSDILRAYTLFADETLVQDVGLIIAGKSRGGIQGEQIGNYIIDNVCEIRKDCVVFISPDIGSVVNNQGNEAQSCVNFRNNLRSSSYGFMDCGYKYMYDAYNDVYRYVPLNGDMAGLAAATDASRDAWWSPAGFNRGQVKNVVKLAWNPNKLYRDQLYKNGINPVVTFNGMGTVLYGDKTLLAKPSAFDRINVRRLFIVLEKAISTAAKYSLFEFNDDFTRSQFKNMVNPYLRDIKGRRGITDFLVVCDSTNNPGQIIDTNQFVGSILVKPARSINFITLNFVAVGTDVDFTEDLNFGG